MKFSLLNLLSLITVIALSIALVSLMATQDPILKISATDSTYSWNLRESLVARSPEWATSEKNPPLAVRDAIDISNGVIEKLETASEPLGVGGWYLESLTLAPLDNHGFGQTENHKWCYLVEFWGTRRPLHSGESETFTAIILMDGTIVVGEGNWRRELDDAMAQLLK